MVLDLYSSKNLKDIQRKVFVDGGNYTSINILLYFKLFFKMKFSSSIKFIIKFYLKWSLNVKNTVPTSSKNVVLAREYSF